MSQHNVVTISLYVEEFMDFESLVSHAYGSRLPYYRGRGGWGPRHPTYQAYEKRGKTTTICQKR